MKRKVSEAVVPPQKPGELTLDYVKRIAELNGWLGDEPEPIAKPMPEVRLPYKEPEDREPGSDDE